jgi:hypothetical protein
MTRILLSFALLLPLLLYGGVKAAGPYTPETLGRLLVTQRQLSDALKGHGSTVTFDAGTDLPSTGDPVGVGRAFAADDGFLTMTLFSLADGSAPEGTLRDGLLSGEFTRVLADASFTGIRDFVVEPSRWGDGLDMLATFLGSADGAQYNVMGCSFIRGNVFGLIMYATTSTNDGTVVASAFEAQLNRLP